ncbi:MAG: hypothetical protein H8E25_09675 [Planctomycetes bacterium]|nr:hypothetical protein [Planctomycetota bacterium]
MRRFALLALPLFFVACEAVDSTSTNNVASINSQQRANFNSGAGNIPTNAAGFLTRAPQFFYPENSNIVLEREIEVPSNSGAYHVFREELRADGQGKFNLNIVEAKLAGESLFGPPSSDLQITYQDQQRYMVQYRDVHLGLQNGLNLNFNWTEDPTLQQIAGVDCVHYTVESVHNLGDFEFWVDANNGMLLAYTMFDNAGDVTLKLTTTTIDNAPVHSNVTWSSSLVGEEYYNPSSNSIALDFEVVEPAYLPPGFYQKNARVLDSFGMFQGMGNMHIALFSDGIHQLFVAQHSDSSVASGTSQVPTAITLARFSEIGGICVVEGNPPLKKMYVVGQMPRDEIHTVFSSLF